MKHRILYNVTVSIDKDVEKEWLEWMKKVHIPDVMRTGFFIENKICRIHAQEEGGVSYAVQYMCLNIQDLEEYQQKHAPRLQEEHTRRYGGKFAAFRTVLEIVHEHKPAITDLHPN